MTKANEDIRKAVKESNVTLWELSDKVGLSYNYFLMKLRHELPSQEKLKLYDCIQQIIDERKEV